MKVRPTVSTDLHLKIGVKRLSPKVKQQRNRQEFMKRVHQTLGWNFVPPIIVKESK